MSHQRLSPLDASFLYVEGPNTHMHVASLTIFEGSIDYHAFLEALRDRLHLVPRYRQRLAEVPLGLGRPVWVDDPYFNLEYHVRHTALPAPGTEEQLKRLCGRVMSQQLDRSRPLWEIWLVDQVAGDRCAMISKVHHCLVDGVSGAELTATLFELSPDGEAVERQPWSPRPVPAPSELLADAVRERATQPREAVETVASALRAPGRVLEQAGKLLGGVGFITKAAVLDRAPVTPINVPVGPHRRFEGVRTSLADFKAVKNAAGATVNDVVLAVVTGALRAFILHRGGDVDGLEMRAFIPVSVRDESERGALGNRVSGMSAMLPVGEPDPLRRLDIVRERMGEAKDAQQAVGAQALTQLSGFAPPTLLAQAARLQSMQRAFNLVITNVPGPQFPLYSVGHKLLDLFPMAPVGANMALTVAVMSYNGQLGFGLLADYDAIRDLAVFADALEKSIQELLELTSASVSGGDPR